MKFVISLARSFFIFVIACIYSFLQLNLLLDCLCSSPLFLSWNSLIFFISVFHWVSFAFNLLSCFLCYNRLSLLILCVLELFHPLIAIGLQFISIHLYPTLSNSSQLYPSLSVSIDPSSSWSIKVSSQRFIYIITITLPCSISLCDFLFLFGFCLVILLLLCCFLI